LFCEDEKKNQFIVEMQNARQTYFPDRAVFYSTFPIQEQAEKGLWNFKLQAVNCVGLLGFNFNDKALKEEETISEYLHMVKLKDQNNHVFYDKLTFVYVELPKFCEGDEEIETHFEKWLYFLKNLENFEEIPNILKETVFEDAFKIAEIANFTEEQRLEYESSLKAYRDSINTIQTARTEGKEEGKIEGRMEVAENMVKLGLSDDVISTATGLSKEALRGNKVSIGKVGTLEVDFVATKLDKKAYYQVSASILSEDTKERELRPLRSINDNYEKVVLTMDKTFIKDFDGIKNVNIIDFLLE
jgi:predicted transposase/invertase (TIGR01784 family)